MQFFDKVENRILAGVFIVGPSGDQSIERMLQIRLFWLFLVAQIANGQFDVNVLAGRVDYVLESLIYKNQIKVILKAQVGHHFSQ